MKVAFDADVLIYSICPHNPIGDQIASFLNDILESDGWTAIGSQVLLPEVLIKPVRLPAFDEVDSLFNLVERLELFPVDTMVARKAIGLGAQYGLKTVDSIHLANAIHQRADQFLTNNKKDFPKSISEIEIIYPSDLPKV